MTDSSKFITRSVQKRQNGARIVTNASIFYRKQVLVDTAGRVERFSNAMEKYQQ
jgi:ribosomal protein L31